MLTRELDKIHDFQKTKVSLRLLQQGVSACITCGLSRSRQALLSAISGSAPARSTSSQVDPNPHHALKDSSFAAHDHYFTGVRGPRHADLPAF